MRSFFSPLLALPRLAKRAIVMAIDASLCVLTVWLAYFLRLGEWVALNDHLIPIALAVALALPIFGAFGLYRIVFRHAGSDAVMSCALACFVYALAYTAFITAYSFEGVPRTLGLLQPILLFLVVAASRVAGAQILSQRLGILGASGDRASVLIYGAGVAGRQLAQTLAASDELRVVGFLDDDRSLHNSKIGALPVFNPKAIEAWVNRLSVAEVLLAIPSASRARRRQVVDKLKTLGLGVRTLPGLMDLAHGTVEASDLRQVTIEDLLQRDPVPYESEALQQHVTDRVILVTGAGGSIGAELCRQIAAMKPRKLLLVEKGEYSLYAIHHELHPTAGERLVPLLASVIDEARMDRIMAAWKPDMIFHAAAYKHVPLVEHNPLEGLRNNVLGTATMARVAKRHQVGDFVLVSTDKAVRPTNVMGASKRLAEMVLQAITVLAEPDSRTCFSMVRFGNVLGSSGSVVPLFTRQIKEGGPVTITHPDITRYFMTIPEAVHLVLQAGAMAEGGEVFVLDMGDPVRIHELARNMIQLSGLSVRDEQNPDGDIEIKTIGLRPGEKLYEELLIGNDPKPTAHPRIMKATEPSFAWPDLERQLDLLAKQIQNGDVPGARKLLCRLVPEYAPAVGLMDWVALEHSAQPGCRPDGTDWAGVPQEALQRIAVVK